MTMSIICPPEGPLDIDDDAAWIGGAIRVRGKLFPCLSLPIQFPCCDNFRVARPRKALKMDREEYEAKLQRRKAKVSTNQTAVSYPFTCHLSARTSGLAVTTPHYTLLQSNASSNRIVASQGQGGNSFAWHFLPGLVLGIGLGWALSLWTKSSQVRTCSGLYLHGVQTIHLPSQSSSCKLLHRH